MLLELGCWILWFHLSWSILSVRRSVGNGDTECCGRMGPPFRLGSRHDLVCI
ncbi:BgtTE-56073 [Blumeria graminis f. sp. tritici]|uniref:BgtTE-56073 n=1 Tax=Blumeria graminis f. sp. tritici TaxID=62690 RepID=A0A9X9QDR1_BLUGR|nr:BgtTE-56073 [Blumeria graminis f. sp. tritici]